MYVVGTRSLMLFVMVRRDCTCVLTTMNARAVVSERSQDNGIVYTYCKADMVKGKCELE